MQDLLYTNFTSLPTKRTHFPATGGLNLNFPHQTPVALPFCPTCEGTGEVAEYEDFGMTVVLAGVYPCPDCMGEEVSNV